MIPISKDDYSKTIFKYHHLNNVATDLKDLYIISIILNNFNLSKSEYRSRDDTRKTRV